MFGLFGRKVNTQALSFWAKEAQKSTELTPDILELEQTQMQLMFIPDEMMSRHHMHEDTIKLHSVYCGVCFAEGTYSMWLKKLGKASYPIILPQGSPMAPAAYIKGELYGVQSSYIKELDIRKQNTLEFTRTRINLILPNRKVVHIKERVSDLAPDNYKGGSTVLSDVKLTRLQAWAYLGIADFWEPLLDGGYLFKPATRHQSKTHNWYYYYFSNKDYVE